MKYRAIAPVTLPVGAAVKLTKAQAHRCRHLVGPLFNGGWCAVKTEFQFKTGEEFETEHVMSKAHALAIGEPEVVAAAPKAAPAAPAKQAVKS